MKNIEVHNPAFDFSIIEKEDGYEYYCYKLKDKVIYEFKREKDIMGIYFKDAYSPDELLNFDAKYFPEFYGFNFELKERVIDSSCPLVEILPHGDEIVFDYFISIENKKILNMKYNPFLLLNTFYKKVFEKGMTGPRIISDTICDLYDSIFFRVKAEGNVAARYREGIQIIEAALKETYKEMERL